MQIRVGELFTCKRHSRLRRRLREAKRALVYSAGKGLWSESLVRWSSGGRFAITDVPFCRLKYLRVKGIPSKARFCYMVCEGNVFLSADGEPTTKRSSSESNLSSIFTQCTLTGLEVTTPVNLLKRRSNFVKHVYIILPIKM
jgi:hypothetical protein